ncbi:MAG: hypothetical protein M1828_005160 [Chrysothrix sp. TS-e1954]|nr:MAG: hypothetical protein M1828_005160 [Chrysothrix sp. TS-e1954]
MAQLGSSTFRFYALPVEIQTQIFHEAIRAQHLTVKCRKNHIWCETSLAPIETSSSACTSGVRSAHTIARNVAAFATVDRHIKDIMQGVMKRWIKELCEDIKILRGIRNTLTDRWVQAQIQALNGEATVRRSTWIRATQQSYHAIRHSEQLMAVAHKDADLLLTIRSISMVAFNIWPGINSFEHMMDDTERDFPEPNATSSLEFAWGEKLSQRRKDRHQSYSKLIQSTGQDREYIRFPLKFEHSPWPAAPVDEDGYWTYIVL